MGKSKRRPAWDAASVRALRQHLGLTQQEMAVEMGTRQQTISEWETGMYQPRGLSERLLSLVAERAAFRYTATGNEQPATRQEDGNEEAVGPEMDHAPT